MEKKEEKKIKEEPKAKTSSTLLIFLLITIFAVVAYLLIWPEYGRLADTEEKIILQKQALEGESKTFRDVSKLLENYADISSVEKEKIEEMLPSEVLEAGLFTLFENLAQKNKIIVLAVDISEKESTENIKNLGISEVQASLNLTTGPDSEDSYGDLKKFLFDLETNLRLIDITSINYTPETATYTLNLKTYRMAAMQNSAGQINP
ncbi:hypothetical protein KKD80_02980 [Patescibacteria group bacterium]|nr:hypothetical protein [Patescibacteria group bacterium]